MSQYEPLDPPAPMCAGCGEVRVWHHGDRCDPCAEQWSLIASAPEVEA